MGPADAPPDPDAPEGSSRPELGRGRGLQRRVCLSNLLAAVLGEERDAVRVGRFDLKRRVGEGGMGVVYRAVGDDGTEVALKLLRAGAEADRRRFEREAAALRSIRHPRVVRYLDHGTTDDGTDYLAMEWLDGADIARALEGGPVAVDAVVAAMLGAAEGLAAAHAVGVVHRDVKPNNLFLVEGRWEDPRVIDFGFAHLDDATTRLTASGAVLGTPAYMAPEQLRGASSIATDIYGLGATMFRLATGRPPYVGRNPAVMLLEMERSEPPLARSLRADLPARLEHLLVAMMARDPAARPTDMASVTRELRQL